MNVDENERNIIITHQFVTGASRSDSEDVSVGGTDNVDASFNDGTLKIVVPKKEVIENKKTIEIK